VDDTTPLSATNRSIRPPTRVRRLATERGERHVLQGVTAMLTMPKLLALTVAVGLTLSMSTAGTALAAKGGKPAPVTAHGSCSVTPNPTPVGGMYTIYGSGFTPYELLNATVTDAHGSTLLFPPVDANGSFAISSYASWAGTDTVNVYDNSGRSPVYLTSCAFQVA
jgi:hypothetical protein